MVAGDHEALDMTVCGPFSSSCLQFFCGQAMNKGRGHGEQRRIKVRLRMALGVKEYILAAIVLSTASVGYLPTDVSEQACTLNDTPASTSHHGLVVSARSAVPKLRL